MTSAAMITDLGEISVEAWANLEEDEPGELVDGRIVEEEMPSNLHEAVAMWIARLLANWVVPRGGFAFGAELKLKVAARRGRKADASAYLPGREPPGRGPSFTRRPPSIVVEVLSPLPRDVRRDLVDKLAEYAAFGVTYYWIVDPLARTFEVRELAKNGPHLIVLAAAEGAHPAPGCDGMVIDLDALWAEVDRLPEGEDDEDV